MLAEVSGEKVAWGDVADLRCNYWGSQDSTEIASWIDDGADDPPGACEFWYCPRDTVEFWPARERSVPNAKKFVGGIKGLFRGGR